MMERIPTWARKWGIPGLIAFVFLTVAGFGVQAVFEQEIQAFWSKALRPFLLSPVTVVIPWWAILVMALLLIGGSTAGFVYLRRALLTRRSVWKHPRSPLPRPSVGSSRDRDRRDDQMDVLKLGEAVRAGEQSPEALARRVEQYLNLGSLTREKAMLFVNDYGYIVYERSDGTWVVRKE